MNDCANAEVRDRLPDLLHDRLDAELRAAIVAHVDACVDCRAELELLRGVREMLAANAASVSRVEVNWVVQALPKPVVRPLNAAPIHAVRPLRRRVWADWRVAAAVTMLVVGGSSVAVLDRSRGVDTILPDSVQLPPESTAALSSGASVPVGTSLPIVTAPGSMAARTVAAADTESASSGLRTDGRLDNLSEQQLKKLLNDIGQMQAVPITDPEPVMIRVDSKNSSTPEEL